MQHNNIELNIFISFVHSASSLHDCPFGPSSVSVLPQLSPKVFLLLCALLSHWQEWVSSPSQTEHHLPCSLILTGSAWLFQPSTQCFWFIFFPFSNEKWRLLPPPFPDDPEVLLKAQVFPFQVPKCSLAQSCPQLPSPWEAACSGPRASSAGNTRKLFNSWEI